MSNSNGTITPSLVAQEALEVLVTSFPMITSFCTDFSAQGIPLYGQTINTRIPQLTTVQNYDTTNGYAPATGTLTNVSLTINNHRHATISFNDQELSSSNLNLIQQHALELAGTIASDIMSGISTLFTTGNYNTYVSLQPQASGIATRITVPVAANNKLDTNLVPASNRILIVNPEIKAELLSDPYIFATLYGGPGTSAPGIPNLAGFNIGTYNNLPYSQNNLVAVAAQRGAVVVAARVPELPSSWAEGVPIPARITNVVDPKTGLTIQVRESYNPQLGQIFCTYTYMLGYAVGNPKSAVIFLR